MKVLTIYFNNGNTVQFQHVRHVILPQEVDGVADSELRFEYTSASRFVDAEATFDSTQIAGYSLDLDQDS